MDFQSWLQIAVVCLLGAVSPGPSLLLVVHNTVSNGRIQGMLTGIGHGLGVGIFAFSAVIGLAVLIDSIPQIFFLANLIGASFLVFLSVRLWVGKKGKKLNNPSYFEETSYLSVKGFMGGLAIALINPKIAVFFVAIFSQFITPNASWSEKGLMALTASIIDMGWYVLVAGVLPTDWLIERLGRNSKIFDRALSFLLCFIAVGLLFKSNKFSEF